MKSLLFIFALSSVLFFSCNSGSEKKALDKLSGEEIHIDNLPAEPVLMKLSDIFELVKIVPLETKEECLIMNIKLTLADDDILIATQVGEGKSAKLFRFNSEGKFINEIGHGGKGSGEHSGYMQSFCDYYSDDNMVLINWNQDDPQLFSLDGEFIKSVKMPYWGLQDIYRAKENNWVSTGCSDGKPRTAKDSMLLVFYNDMGEVLHSIPRNVYPPENVKGYVAGGWGSSVFKYRSQLKIYFPGIDTIFSLKGDELIPVDAIHVDGNINSYNEISNPKALKGKYDLSFLAETDNNIIIKQKVIEEANLEEYKPGTWGGSFRSNDQLIVMDKSSKKIAVCIFEDDILGFLPEIAIPYLDFHDNGFVTFSLAPVAIQKMIAKYESETDVPAEIAARLEPLKIMKEDDNPIVFIFKLKDKISIE